MRFHTVRRKIGWISLFVLLALSGSEFVIRGPVRLAHAGEFNDFLSPYAQTRAWLRAMDPYSSANLVALWPPDAGQFSFLKRESADGSLALKRGIPTAYPPTTFVLLAPIALLSWHTAHFVWSMVLLLAFAITMFSLGATAGCTARQKRTYVFAALALALAPIHSGLAVGSVVIVAIAACAAGVWAQKRGWSVRAGMLLSIAIALKPQIGLPFLAYYVLHRRWRLAAAALVVLGVLVGVGLFHLAQNHTPWFDSYRADNRALFAYGSLGDFTEHNQTRFGLINLQVLLYLFVPERATVNILALALTCVLGIVWLVMTVRHPNRDDLLELSGLLVLSLLPIYHRFYDASLLIFPLTWTVTALSWPFRKLAATSLGLILLFLVAGGSMLEKLQTSHHMIGMQHSWWWTHVVMPHQVWALLGLSLVLICALKTNSRDASYTSRNRSEFSSHAIHAGVGTKVSNE